METVTITEQQLEDIINRAKVDERNRVSSQLRMWVNAFPIKSEYTDGVLRAALIVEGIR